MVPSALSLALSTALELCNILIRVRVSSKAPILTLPCRTGCSIPGKRGGAVDEAPRGPSLDEHVVAKVVLRDTLSRCFNVLSTISLQSCLPAHISGKHIYLQAIIAIKRKNQSGVCLSRRFCHEGPSKKVRVLAIPAGPTH